MEVPLQSEPPDLPVGWRFHPTDFELLDHYLKKKRLGHAIAAYGFNFGEFQLCNFDPLNLPDSPDKEWYFFCRPEIYLENGRAKRKRKAMDGSWRWTGKVQSVINEYSHEKIGTRKILVYHDPKPTKWVIHEYEYTADLNLPTEVKVLHFILLLSYRRHAVYKSIAFGKLLHCLLDCVKIS
ncbi:hypothetical protein JCGZ_14159 [Jatropha curcas]|uniref:NAC transcription factor 067 n=1 Tax=Jatropha curcas TaxID=180498 RepID=R4N7S1_JATCU|nr:NAC transcription factor 067 [Jatropha curcas]KDP28388.1 hypothetical protein JCGZ_14159 [Jatropha curcas]